MFAFLIIWIHLKQNRFNLKCFTLLEERGKKKILKDEIVSMSPFWQKCLGSCHTLVTRGRWEGKGGQNCSDGQPRIQEGPPKSFPEGENLGKYWQVHNDIPIFYSFPFQRRRGRKVLWDRTIEKATASNFKPALCVDIVYTYQYIDICGASYLYIPITYIVYGTKVLDLELSIQTHRLQ